MQTAVRISQKTIAGAGATALTLLLVVALGCQSFDQAAEVGTRILVQQDVITTNEAESITRSAQSFARALAAITPEQEYYIGRSVGARLLGRYPPYTNRRANDYLNTLGQTLASVSDRPETFGGYHFLALDTESVNAFAAPGGLIFVSRGMLRLCRREAHVAAVLAHEIAHVQDQHGLKAIKRDRWASAFLITGTELLRQEEPDMRELTESFDGVVDGIANVLFVRGYTRDLESEADRAAVKILKRIGYDPNALAEMLDALSASERPGGYGFSQTHPNSAQRARMVRSMAGAEAGTPATAARERRFAAFADAW